MTALPKKYIHLKDEVADMLRAKVPPSKIAQKIDIKIRYIQSIKMEVLGPGQVFRRGGIRKPSKVRPRPQDDKPMIPFTDGDILDYKRHGGPF